MTKKQFNLAWICVRLINKYGLNKQNKDLVNEIVTNLFPADLKQMQLFKSFIIETVNNHIELTDFAV